MNQTATTEKTQAPDKGLTTHFEDVDTTLRRAESGDIAVLPRLREILREPKAVEPYGNLARLAQVMRIDKFAGKNLMLKESVGRKIELMRAELEGPNPLPLEKLLVERICSCWLYLHTLETTYASKEVDIKIASHFQRSIDRAQKCYLAAIKTLTIIRKLALPVLQVNIARKQVNVAGSFIDAKEKEKPHAPSGDAAHE